MNGKIDINISMSVPADKPEELTPLERELMDGWMNNPMAEPKPKPSSNRTSLIAKQLKTCSREFVESGMGAEVSFYEYLQHMYGIKLHTDQFGNIYTDYDIVDERKFTLFKLNYSL